MAHDASLTDTSSTEGSSERMGAYAVDRPRSRAIVALTLLLIAVCALACRPADRQAARPDLSPAEPASSATRSGTPGSSTSTAASPAEQDAPDQL